MEKTLFFLSLSVIFLCDTFHLYNYCYGILWIFQDELSLLWETEIWYGFVSNEAAPMESHTTEKEKYQIL